MSGKNEGIIVSGSGKFEAGAAAAGQRAVAVNVSTAESQVLAGMKTLIGDLVANLSSESGQAAGGRGALPIAEALSEEVSAARPRRIEIQRLLSALTSGMGLTGGLLDIVEHLQRLATSLL